MTDNDNDVDVDVEGDDEGEGEVDVAGPVIAGLARWTRARAALEPLWAREQDGAVGPPSRGMATSAVQVVRLLGGKRWQIVSGLVTDAGPPYGAVHVWTEHETTGEFLDLTDDQHGYPPVQLGMRPPGYLPDPYPVATTVQGADRARRWVAELAVYGYLRLSLDRGDPLR